MEILEDRLVKELPITLVANTHSGDGTPFRGNYAGIGYTYDADNDVFIAPKPYSKLGYE